MPTDDEEGLLRSVALQNAKSIHLARQRAEDELIQTKEALELKTKELARSLAMMRATLESTTDGILVTDVNGKVIDFNDKYLQMWGITRDVLASRDHHQVLGKLCQNFQDPAQFRADIEAIYATAPSECFHLLELVDGRVFERHSRTQSVDGEVVGRVWSLRDITAHRRDREALAKQSEQLRVTLASIGDAVIATDTDGRVVLLNRIAEALTGWSQAEAAGLPLQSVFHIINEQTRHPVENPAQRALNEGVIVGMANHTILIAKNGAERPIDDSAAPIHDEKGRLVGSVLVFRDITDRRRAERILQHSEEELRDFFENAPVGLHWVGPDGTILRANDAELALLGYESAEYVGKHIAEFHADAQVIDAILGDLSAGKTLREYPARLRCKDGSIKHVLIHSNALWEGGKFIHSRCFTRDVTDQKRVQEAQTLLAAIVEASEDAIVSKTLDGVIRSWNGGAERLFGYTAAEAVGQSIELIVPVTLRDEERSILRRLSQGERIEHFETKRVSKRGRIMDISLTISPMRDSTGRIIGASKVARDITESKRASEELRKLAADLSEADRRKNEFLAMLAHELRNPLAPIRNALQIMQLTAGNAEAVLSAAAVINRQVRQMVRLVDDLLDVSRINRGTIEVRRERVDLASIIHQAVETSRPAIDAAKHELILTLPAQPIWLYADPVRLAQAISNLLNNASKYSEPNGRITLTVARGNRDVTIAVKDTGLGIPPDMLPKIFDMFTQVDRSLERAQSGLGIGLTLVQRLVELHGGTVSAFSEGLDRGSEFTITLPILVDRETPAHASSGESPTAVTALRIQVVDDNRDAATSLAMLLKLMGHEIQVAHDGLEAVELADRFRPQLILLDIGMPKLNGYEAARRIREQPWGKRMMLVALSGWGQEEDRLKSREAGFNDHLIKPVDGAILQKLLASVPADGS